MAVLQETNLTTKPRSSLYQQHQDLQPYPLSFLQEKGIHQEQPAFLHPHSQSIPTVIGGSIVKFGNG